MSWQTRVLGALALALLLTPPVAAQEQAVTIALRGGGFNSLSDVDQAGTSDLKKVGYDLGGGLGVDLTRYLGVRGDFTFARNQLRQNDIKTGRHLNRFFYDGAVQLQYPAASGVRPYVFLGAGAVTLHPVGTSGDNQTKFAGTGGLGMSYALLGSGVGLFVEGKSWLYKLSGLSGGLNGFDRTQFDVTWSAGLSYRLPLGSAPAAQASR